MFRGSRGSSITDAEKARLPGGKHGPAQAGQSIIEFLLLLPMLLGLLVIMTRVNQAIQSSIVNQQYLRSQVLFLAFNSNTYPERTPERPYRQRLTEFKANQLVMVLGANVIPEDVPAEDPISQTQVITRKKTGGPKGQPGQEADQTGEVRIMTTASICTQSNVMRGTAGIVPLNSGSLQEGVVPANFLYCHSNHSDMGPN